MSDQMTPAEMRAESVRLRDVADANADHGWENNAESCRAGADALDRLADVIEYAYDLHSGTCHDVLSIARGESGNTRSAVRLLTGATDDELDELGGFKGEPVAIPSPTEQDPSRSVLIDVSGNHDDAGVSGNDDEPIRDPQPCTVCGTNGGYSPWHRENRCVNHLRRGVPS